MLFIPSLLESAKCIFTFHCDHCVIQDISKTHLIGMAKREWKHFYLKPPNENNNLLVFSLDSNSKINNDTVWHYRLGHPSCKTKKVTFVSNHNIAKEYFNVEHIDIWEPYNTLTIGGHKYFITIVDDHSRKARGIKEWDDAMDTEIDALEKNYSSIVVSLLADHHAIGCRWVYKIKYNVDGSVERFKARLVAKGYNKQEGIHYTDNFTSVTKFVTVKLFLALAAVHGYTPTGTLPPNVVCKLQKFLYGLKQASRQWFQKFSTVVIVEGFHHHSATDHSLFIRQTKEAFIIRLIHVDDVILASNNLVALEALKVKLNNKF
uniref:Reverse transcriptase Ty1/copia-type domain-containing protein n=1 Tax=Cannabis sativa TaxID=3483 RepID=A0A803P4I6_CANSA